MNGDSLIDVTSSVLRMIQRFKSDYLEDGKWGIPFADFSMITQEGQNLTSLVTLPSENIVLKVETGASTQEQVDGRSVAAIRAEGILGVSHTQCITVLRIYRNVMNSTIVLAITKRF
jgi:hypothetical protein